jgi:hypothetical protein
VKRLKRPFPFFAIWAAAALIAAAFAPGFAP